MFHHPSFAWLPLTMTILLGCAGPALAADEPAAGPRTIIPFDNDWRFHLGDDPAGRQPGFDDAAWRTLDCRMTGASRAPSTRRRTARKTAAISSTASAGTGKVSPCRTPPPKQVVIEFDGVYMNSEVWLNGHFLGPPAVWLHRVPLRSDRVFEHQRRAQRAGGAGG